MHPFCAIHNIMAEKKQSKFEVVDDLFENIGKPVFINDECENTVDKKEKYDLWKTLAALRKRDFEYLNKVNDDEKKHTLQSIYVLMKWYSNPVSMNKWDYMNHIILLNELVNVGFWELTGNDNNNHSELIWKLMCMISDGSAMRHSWIPLQKRSSSKIDKFLLTHMPLTSSEERYLWVVLNGKEGLNRLYEKVGGNDKKLINDLMIEYDSYISL